jgi:tetratricopeptide (TPR) repeat protein
MINIAIQQNNIAASMIERGQYIEAINILKVMIANIRDDLRDQMVKKNHSDESSESDESESPLQQFILQSLKDRPGQDDGILYMYNQAVHIPLHVATVTDNAPAAISSVLIFNFALAQHMSADKTANKASRDSCLAKALSLYRLVMALNSRSTLLRMIVLINVGLIHRRYNDHSRAQECFNRLLTIWLHSPVHMRHHLEGMIFNAAGWYDGTALPAPAA